MAHAKQDFRTVAASPPVSEQLRQAYEAALAKGDVEEIERLNAYPLPGPAAAAAPLRE